MTTWTSDLHDDAVYSAVFSPDGTQVLTGTCDAFGNGLARLWDIDTGYEDQVFSGHDEGAVRSVVFSPDGAQVLTGCDDHTAKLWDVDTGQVIRTFSHDGAVYSVDFALNGLRVMTTTTGTESLAVIWSTADGSQLTTFTGHSGGVAAGKFVPKPIDKCSLPIIIDHYRHNEPEPEPQHRLGGFFSSGFQLMNAPMGKKRLLNECNHNYLWLGFATGSVGGPAADHPSPQRFMHYYDVGGRYYTNPIPPNPGGELLSLNCQTDEILDSFLSLSRFTSLVRWRYVKDSEGDVGEPAYRPIRAADSPQSVVLKDGPSGSVLPTTDWIWTGASDGAITVGWILRNYGYDPGERWYPWAGYVTPDNPPWVEITGLDTTVDLELVWFDDQRGILLDRVDLGQAGQFVGYAPETEGAGNGFGKSIAFLIQPEGFTPEKVFAPLPNEPISLILVDTTLEATPDPDNITLPPRGWDEEWAEVVVQKFRFVVKTKPPLTEPERYRYQWRGYTQNPLTKEWQEVWPEHDGLQYEDHTPAPDYTGPYRVAVTIRDRQQGEQKITGDIIHLNLYPSRQQGTAPGPNCLDFNEYAIQSYGGSQDTTGTVTIEDDGLTLHMVGNLWKKIEFETSYTVTADTVLEFDFKSEAEGEIHAIGFDVSDSPAGNHVFQLYGTQAGWGRPDFNDYSQEDDWKHYVIPVGQFYTGNMPYMVFIMDHDVQEPTGESLFSNVEVYESD